MRARASRVHHALDAWWEHYRRPMLAAAIVVMAAVSVVWLSYQFWRLLWQPEVLAGRPVHPGAVDLMERHQEVHAWFAGEPVLNDVYPPASYLLLWPLVGWLPLQAAVKGWAVTSLIALVATSVLMVRHSGLESRLGRTFAALLPLSMYAAGATIGNGQLNLHVLPLLVAAVVVLRRDTPSWRTDLLGGLLMLASLMKPNVSAPFFLMVLLGLGRLRPALLVVSGYAVLALAAAPFQPGNVVTQFVRWVSFGSGAAFYSSGISPEATQHWTAQLSINAVQFLLAQADLQSWATAASLVILVALGLWIYLHRHADTWALLAVCALAARFWTYHRWYDDLVILLPLVALLRVVATQRRPWTTASGWLLAGGVLTSLAPGGLFLLPQPWSGVYVVAQTVLWTAMIGFFVRHVGRQRRGAAAKQTPATRPIGETTAAPVNT